VCQNRVDLGRRTAASGCMRWLGGTTPEGRANLPAMLAPEGAAWDRVRARSSCALMGAMAVGCVPRAGARGRCPRWRSHALAVGCAVWNAVRGPSPRWLVQAMDAFPAIALACPIVRVGSQAAAITGLNHALASPQIGGSCPPNAWRISRAAPNDRKHRSRHRQRSKWLRSRGRAAASGCMRWLGGTTPEGRADLPAMLAPEGGA
jgi:hypothetical protein